MSANVVKVADAIEQTTYALERPIDAKPSVHLVSQVTEPLAPTPAARRKLARYGFVDNMTATMMVLSMMSGLLLACIAAIGWASSSWIDVFMLTIGIGVAGGMTNLGAYLAMTREFGHLVPPEGISYRWVLTESASSDDYAPTYPIYHAKLIQLERGTGTANPMAAKFLDLTEYTTVTEQSFRDRGDMRAYVDAVDATLPSQPMVAARGQQLLLNAA